MARPVLLRLVAKARTEAHKHLDPAVEALLSGTSPALKLSELWRVMRVGSSNDLLLTGVSLVANQLLPLRNLLLESISEDCDVMR